jgi:serine/threonine-protein kinase
MAPEVLEGQAASVRSDIYSVGVLLYHLVTGSYPVEGRSVAEVRDAHARGARTFLRDARPDLPDGFVQVVERALSPHPDGRYASGGAMEAALAATVQPRTSWPWPTLALAASLLVVLGTGAIWLTAPTSKPPAIVVLPFRNLSAEPDSEDFVDGLTEEVIGNLSGLDGLAVRSSYSSFTFKNKPRDVREVLRQLRADYVLDASVLRAGTQLRITVGLVDADDVTRWSVTYQRELKDIFAIQEEISREIVNRLRLKLGRGQRRYSDNVEAYELYLKGLALVRRGFVSSLEKAIGCFEQALAKDPSFAPAHAGRANAYAFMVLGPRPPNYPVTVEMALPIIRAAADQALRLDPLLADAEAARGMVLSSQFDWTGAEQAFQRAIELSPSLTPTYTMYSFSTLRPLGRYDEALQLLRVALENDPLSLDVQREIGMVQREAGQDEKAVETLQRVREVEPDFPYVGETLALALTAAGRPKEALTLFDRNDQLSGRPRRSPRRAFAYVALGRHADAEALAAEHEDNRQTPALALIYAALGDKDRAFDALYRMPAVESLGMPRLLAQPEMAALRGDPRMTALRKRFNLP